MTNTDKTLEGIRKGNGIPTLPKDNGSHDSGITTVRRHACKLQRGKKAMNKNRKAHKRERQLIMIYKAWQMSKKRR